MVYLWKLNSVSSEVLSVFPFKKDFIRNWQSHSIDGFESKLDINAAYHSKSYQFSQNLSDLIYKGHL